jgi:glycosyltransferase involved in cell wall biosynthesis
MIGREASWIMQKKKISFIITSLGIGGAEMMLLRLLKVFDREKFEISLISLKSGGALEKDFLDLGIPFFSAEMNSIMGTINGYLKLRRIIGEVQPQIVFCWMYHANLIGGLAARRCGVKEIYWNIRNSGLKQFWKAPITAVVVRLGAHFSKTIPEKIIINSDQARINHIQMGYEEIKLQVIFNGIDTNLFKPDPSVRDNLRNELNCLPSTLLVGMAARFHPQKDHRTFIEAANYIKHSIPEIKFVLCGKGIDNSNNELTAWIKEFDLKSNVVLLGERRDMPQLLNALDLLILSSAYGESFPNVIAEAMSCTVPCVATDVGGSSNIVGNAGFIVPPGNSRALANAAINMLTKKRLRNKFGAAARKRIINEFSIEKISAEYENLFLKKKNSQSIKK